MTTDDEALVEVAGKISAYVEQQFATGSQRVFLSSLGSNLGSEKQRIEELTGQKFAEIIRTTLDYPIGITGEHKNILFLVPRGTSPEVIEESSPRFNASFWTAFARPLADGEQRFINLNSLRFGSKVEVADNETGALREIEAKFVATEETSRDIADMVRRIDGWLSEQSLTRGPFLAKARKARTASSNLLSELLSTLSHDQLRRTTLPLDVVKSLMS